LEGPNITQIIPGEEVEKRVAELAETIADDFGGTDFLVIGILEGARVFVGELVKHWEPRPAVDFVVAKSYGSSTEGSGHVEMDFRVKEKIEGRRVLLVDDVADSGLTLHEVGSRLARENPSEIKTCVVCNKTARRKRNIKLDYVGFFVPNRFLVGFGMGYGGLYRDLPYIGFL